MTDDLFTQDERARLDAAVADAEARTGAEIVLMVLRRATDTRSAEMVLAALLALGLPAALLPFPEVPALVIWLAQLVSFVAFAVLFPVFDLGVRLLPQDRLRREVREAAEAQFFAHGLRNTKERAAVLVLVAWAERQVEIVWDDRAGEAVGPAEWRGVAGTLARDLKAGGRTDALCAAAARIGDLLSGPFPRGSGDENELPDVILP